MSDTHGPDGRVALITGASSGIGAAFARALAREGHDLWLVARRRERLKTLAQELHTRYGVQAAVRVCDLSDVDALSELCDEVAESRSVDRFVHAAGFGTRAPFAEVPGETLTSMVRVHVEAAVRLSRAVLPGMLDRGTGRIVFVASMAAFFTTKRYVLYSATKTLLKTLALGFREELVGTDVRVQALCPGLTRTEFFERDDFGFSYSDVPHWAWMSSDSVVRSSLAGLRRNQTIVIPGVANRLFFFALEAPVFGTLTRIGMRLASRSGKEVY
ncbi:MAG: SDR family oxidoreductase [Deltaproteobacteria bacterium]|nr:SDR family oxidoreductase [Deltaproteobacteria bacterium]